MAKPILYIVLLIIGCSFVTLMIIGESSGLAQIVWMALALIALAVCFNDARYTFNAAKRVVNLAKDSESIRIDNLKQNGEVIVVTLADCNIRSDIKRLNKRYILFERMQDGIKYEYASRSTYYSTKYIKLLVSSTRSFTLYIDKSNPKNYYFDTPF